MAIHFYLKTRPFKVYRQHLGDYMLRWVIQHPLGTVRLHVIRRPDEDPDMHDHPWSFVSLLLWGTYDEERPAGTREVRWVNVCKADGLHRIVKLHRPSVVTLVFTGPRVRNWGFATKDGWVGWRDYVSSKIADINEYAAAYEAKES